METVYLVSAIVGGTLILCQFVMGLVGLGGQDMDTGDTDADAADGADHDHDHDHDVAHSASWFVGVLSFRAIVAAMTFFGLTGMAVLSSGADEGTSFLAALAAAAAAVAIIYWTMKALFRLKSDGTMRIDRAVGHSGTVYLRVPSAKSGVGKVHLSLQNRTVELQAVTPRSEPLPTGSKVVVVGVVSSDTVEVVPANECERTTHV
jgi:hypothetical protein